MLELTKIKENNKYAVGEVVYLVKTPNIGGTLVSKMLRKFLNTECRIEGVINHGKWYVLRVGEMTETIIADARCISKQMALQVIK
jgi:hypothetical protein